MSDGVPQSGLGNNRFPMGWGMEKIEEFCFKPNQPDAQYFSDKTVTKNN